MPERPPAPRARVRAMASSVARFAGAWLAGVWLVAGGPATAAPKAKPAEPEPPITAKGPEGEYLRLLHSRVHARWTDNFLHFADTKLPPQNPINDRSRTVLIRLILSPDGQILSTRVLKESGWLGFDDAAKEAVRDAVPFPATPVTLRSDDGNVHIDWLFARDARRDSTLTLKRFEQPFEVALPGLIQTGRREDVVRRLKVARSEGRPIEPLVTLAAFEWLRGSLTSPYAQVETASLLADRNDPAAIRWLKTAVRNPEVAGAAGAALSARRHKVCPLVKEKLDSLDAAAQTAAAQALSEAGEAECRAPLHAILHSKAPLPTKVAALAALGSYNDEASRSAVAQASSAGNASIRVGAVAAMARGAARGRAAVLTRFLRDPSPEVRAAAAAGIVRAGGRLTPGDLDALVADEDPAPAAAAADALANRPDGEAAQALARLLARKEPEVQAKVARGIVMSGEESAFATLAPFMNPETPPEVRAWALVAADGAKLTALANDPRFGSAVYRAYLARGQRGVAADWLLTHILKLPPGSQDQVMFDWLTARPRPPEPATVTPPATAAAAPDARAVPPPPPAAPSRP